VPPRGDFETVYLGWDGKQRVPCGGLDYSAPYNALPQNSLAPGTVNTQTINGVLCSSPPIAEPPWTQILGGQSYLGVFPFTFQDTTTGLIGCVAIVVTDQNVYFSQPASGVYSPSVTQLSLDQLVLLNAWGSGDIDTAFDLPGQPVSFVQVENTIYFTGLMFNGIYSVTYNSGGFYSFTFGQATAYVSAGYLFVLDGYMCAAQCRFPGGGGTGTSILPTIAWSVPGGFTTWDPTVNPQAGYNQLPDVSDRITGVATEGRSAFIFRLHGITQQDPNLGSGAGLQPFVWYHLWASPQGIGAYDNTVAQFGEVAIFLSSDNVYALSLSAGVQPMGQKIISRINRDALIVGAHLNGLQTDASTGLPYAYTPYYYYGSIVEIAGELHYLLTFSWNSFGNILSVSSAAGGYVYDLNMMDNAWHVWDMSQYYEAGGGTWSRGFSTPIVQIKPIEQVLVSNGSPPPTDLVYQASPNYYLFGGFTKGMYQFIPVAYNNQTLPTVITNLLVNFYNIIDMPITTIVFRGETVKAGDKVTCRRIILQNDSVSLAYLIPAPYNPPTSELAYVTMLGSNQSLTCPAVNLFPKTTGSPIQTYYADGVLSDEMIQCSITTQTGTVTGGNGAFVPMATFRLTQVSFVGNDPTGSKV